MEHRDREVLGIEELSEQDIHALEIAEVPPEYDFLNELLK
jgi:hypothetical protein